MSSRVFLALLCVFLFVALPQLTPRTTINCACLKSGLGLVLGGEPKEVDLKEEIKYWEKKYSGQHRRLWTEIRDSIEDCSLASCRPGSLMLVSSERGVKTTECLTRTIATTYSNRMSYAEPYVVDCALYHSVAPELALEQIIAVVRRKVDVEGSRAVVFVNFQLLPSHTTSLLFDVFSSCNEKIKRTLFLFTLQVDSDWSDPEKWAANARKFLAAHLHTRDPVSMNAKTSERLVSLVTKHVGWVDRDSTKRQCCALVDNT